MKKNRRTFKNFLLNNDFQLRVVLYTLLYLFVGSIITSGAILLPEMLDMLSGSDPELQYRAAKRFISLSSRLIPGLCVLIALSCFHMVVLTHRICGPIYNVINILNRFRQGKLNARVSIRKNDFLQEESRQVNALGRDLSIHIKEIKEEIEAIDRIASQEGGKDELQQHTRNLKKQISIFSV